MTRKKIIAILGHPDTQSFCASIAMTYVKSAESAGHVVRLYKLGEMAFAPTLHHGYREIQELEPDLKSIQDSISWASHLVFVYPNWWGSMPSLLKGFFDRVFLPGYAFKYRDNSHFRDKLLSGRSAHVFVTMDTPRWYYRLDYRMPGHHQIRKSILGVCGIAPTTITSFGPVRFAKPEQREDWLAKVARLAAMS